MCGFALPVSLALSAAAAFVAACFLCISSSSGISSLAFVNLAPSVLGHVCSRERSDSDGGVVVVTDLAPLGMVPKDTAIRSKL